MGDTDLQVRHNVKFSAARAEEKLFSEPVILTLSTTDLYVEQVPQKPEVNQYHRIK